MGLLKCPFFQRILPAYEGCNCIWNEESVSRLDNFNKLNQSSTQTSIEKTQKCNFQTVLSKIFASCKFAGNKVDDLIPDNQKKFEKAGRTSDSDIQHSFEGQSMNRNLSVNKSNVTLSVNAATISFEESFLHSRIQQYCQCQRNCPFCRQILHSYEGCNCIWNEDDGNEESISETNSFSKLNQNCQHYEEPQKFNLQLVKSEIFSSTNYLRNNVADGLFFDNRKKRKVVRKCVSAKEIQRSSRDKQNVKENVTSLVNAPSKSLGESFLRSRTKTHKCSLCPKTFSTYYKHQRHILIHTKELPFECSSCGRKFNQKAHLESHRGLYSDGKIFICDQCGIEFDLKCALEVHLRSVKESRHFVCDFCHRKFFKKRHLREHQRSHSRERPYKCNICEKDYVYSKGLRKHRKKHHQKR